MHCGNQNKIDYTKTHTVTIVVCKKKSFILVYFKYLFIFKFQVFINKKNQSNIVGQLTKLCIVQRNFTNICNGIFHISFFKALLINRGERDLGRNDPVPFAMAIWNSTCNPCFSTFDQFFFVFHGLKTVFFCYSLKLNFICYPNRFFTYDYSLWDGGRHTFLRAKTNFNFDIKSSFVCSFCPSIFD